MGIFDFLKKSNDEKNKKNKVSTREEVVYHENGKIRAKVILDANDNHHGNCKEWYKSGKIFKEENFKHGVNDGSFKEYFENGNLRIEYDFKDGVRHGVSNNYYEDGSNDIIVNCKNGNEHGMKETYYPSGALESRTNYVDGQKEGAHIYLDESGEVIEDQIMQKGLDLTMEITQLIMLDTEHLAHILKDGPQESEPGEMSQKIYDYYKANNLRVESAQVSVLKEMYKKGEINKEFYDISMAGLGQL